jgi:hypothetical protein
LELDLQGTDLDLKSLLLETVLGQVLFHLLPKIRNQEFFGTDLLLKQFYLFVMLRRQRILQFIDLVIKIRNELIFIFDDSTELHNSFVELLNLGSINNPHILL